MKLTRLFSYAVLFLVTLISTNLSAQDPMQVCDPPCGGSEQVTSVKYFCAYNPEGCMNGGYLWDFYIYIEEGCASGVGPRAQFNSQYTVVLPTGTSILANPIGNMPLVNNQTYTGTTPAKWSISDVAVNPASAPGNDFYSIVPTINPAAFYNNLCQGDSVKVFSLLISLVPDCGQGVRIYDNDTDPDSSAEGMGGGDFSNGFTIGGSLQKYNGNLPRIDPPAPDGTASNLCTSPDLQIDLVLDSFVCQSPYTYNWSGPGGYSGTSQDVNVPNATDANNGLYTVTITDVMGCDTIMSFEGEVKPDAGEDAIGCTNSSVNLQGANPTTGTWSEDPANGTGYTFTPGAGGAATVDFDATAMGTYQFIYTNVMCSDTVLITIEDVDAGPDPTPVNCFSAGTASLNAVSTGGVWSAGPSNPGTATISTPNQPSTNVTDFSAPGTYTFVYSVGACFDEVTLVVNENCDCPIVGNSISPLSPNTYCGNSEVQLVDGATASPVDGTYLWQVSVDGGAFADAPGTNTNEDYTTLDYGEGVYTFRRLFNLDTGGLPCSDTSNVVTMTVNFQPGVPTNINASPGVICDNETSTISVDNLPGATYSWTSSPAIGAGLGASTTNTVVMSPTAPGVYTISVTQTVNGCVSDPATVVVTVNEVPPTPGAGDFTSSNPSACAANDGFITISNLGANTNYTIEYDFNGSPQSASVTSSGTGLATIGGLVAGSYSNISVVSTAGCATTPFPGPFVLSDPLAPDAPEDLSASPNPECVNLPITITASNVAGATYNWAVSDPAAGLQSATTVDSFVTLIPTAPGFYTVSVTVTIDGCTSPENSMQVQVNSAPPTPTGATVTGTNPTVCGGSDGFIQMSGLANNTTYEVVYSDNGTPDTLSLITNGSGTLTIPGLTEGTYTNFSLTNATGCSSEVYPGPVNLSDPGSPAAPANLMATPNPICLGDAVSLSVDPFTGATFNWSASAPEAGLGTSTSNTISMTPTAIGTYTISVSQTVAGCTSPASTIDVEVQETPITPTNATGTDPTACSGSDGFITITGYTANAEYILNYFDDGVASSVNVTASATGELVITGLNAGTYSDFQVSNAADCPSGVFAGPVNLVDPDAPAPPTGIVVSPNPICQGEATTISVDNDPLATYTWSVTPANAGFGTSTTNSISFTPTASGVFTVSVTQTIANCVSSAASTNVIVEPSPPTPIAANITSTNPTVCTGADGTITISGLTASETYGVQFEKDMTVINDVITANTSGQIVIGGLTSGSYTNVILTNSSGCSSGTFSGPINLSDPGAPLPPTLTANPNPICLGETVNLTATGEAGATFTWTASSPDAGLGTSTTGSNTATPTAVGTYTIFVSQSVAGCTSDPSSIVIEVFDVPNDPNAGSVSSTDPSACGINDGTISISGLMPSTAYTINYTFNGLVNNVGVTSDGSGSASLTDLALGDYTDFSVTNSANCQSGVFPGPVTLVGPAAPPAPSGLVADPNPVCFTGTVNLSVTNNPGATYEWTTADANAGLIASSTNTTSMTALQPGTYVINVTQTLNGCTSPAATVTVVVNPLPTTPDFGDVTSTDPTACGVNDGSITIGNLIANANYTLYYEMNGSPVSVPVTANAQGEISITDLFTGSYTNFQLESEDGCLSGVFAGPVTLLEPDVPNAPTNLNGVPNPVCLGMSVSLGVDITANAIYNWSISPQNGGQFSAGSSNSATFTPDTPGEYTVSVSQTIDGCTSPATSITVVVKEHCLNPDFGVTYNNYTLTGNLSTNDMETTGTTYGNPVVNGSNPDACMPIVNPNGMYTFDCATIGEYSFLVEVCPAGQSVSCHMIPLEITVLDVDATDNAPIANLDYVHTITNTSTAINILENDECQSIPNCTLGQPTLIAGPYFGTFNTSTLVYTPNVNFTGRDSFRYQVCQTPATAVSCDQEWVYIDVYPEDADEFISAMDDYDQTSLNNTLDVGSADGLLANDTDPQGLPLSVSPSVDAVAGKGDITINSDGSYTFIPALDFIGQVDFAYQVCRNSNPNICDSATLHLLVEPQAAAGFVASCAWIDNNGNGQLDAGEAGLPGVDVVIYLADGTVVDSTVTDELGEYTFEDIPIGEYYLSFVAADNYTLTVPNVGNDLTDSDVDDSNGPNTTATFFVDAGTLIDNVKAGYYECVLIGDNVWYDVNMNDIYDSFENGINALRVNLYRLENGGYTLYDFTYTGHKPNTPSDDGWFNFCAPPGTYYIQIDLPPLGLVQVIPFVGNDPFRDSDINNANGPGSSPSFTIQAGSSKLDLGAGYYPMASVGNLVWHDENFDGIQNPDESRVANVLVQAYDANTYEMIGQDTTDEDGVYEIDYLEKKDVYFKFTPPGGMVATVADVGYDNIDSDVNHDYGLNTTKAYKMVPNNFNETIDFGVAFGALPVRWVSIDVTERDGNHLLEWVVDQEINVESYEIERKIEGENEYTSIGFVAYNDKTEGIKEYNFIDDNVLKGGNYYYRVKQHDLDGKFNYSKIVSIANTRVFETQLFPNPTNSQVNVSFALEYKDNCKIQLLTPSGSLVREYTYEVKKGINNISLDIQDIPEGVYNVVIEVGADISHKKLIKIQ